MFVDASAIIAIIAREPDAVALAGRLGQARRVYVSPIAIYEATVGLARIGNTPLTEARSAVDRLLAEVRAEMVAIDADDAVAAIDAFDRFGKGRHAAALNMGDCFAYACAKRLEVPLLFKGNDFPRTDVAAS